MLFSLELRLLSEIINFSFQTVLATSAAVLLFLLSSRAAEGGAGRDVEALSSRAAGGDVGRDVEALSIRAVAAYARDVLRLSLRLLHSLLLLLIDFLLLLSSMLL